MTEIVLNPNDVRTYATRETCRKKVNELLGSLAQKVSWVIVEVPDNGKYSKPGPRYTPIFFTPGDMAQDGINISMQFGFHSRNY